MLINVAIAVLILALATPVLVFLVKLISAPILAILRVLFQFVKRHFIALLIGFFAVCFLIAHFM